MGNEQRPIEDTTRITQKDFTFRVFTGTTSGTANTKLLIPHNLKQRPFFAVARKGNVYIQQVTDQYVDVRSTGTSVPFEIVVIL